MKSHLTKYDQLFFAADWPTLVELVDEKQEHISLCRKCNKQIKILRNWLNHHKYQNNQTCDLFFDRILKNMVFDSTNILSDDLLLHLESCERCKSLYQFYNSIPTFEEVRNIDIPFSKGYFTAVDLKIKNELEIVHNSDVNIAASIKEITQKVGKKITEGIRQIKVEVMPIPHLGMVRGEMPQTVNFYSHPGGELRLVTKIPQHPVKLYAIFHETEFVENTDKEGCVIFSKLPEDDYRIIIDGFEVSDIQDMIEQ